jgi:hypothetical protein
LNDKAYKTNPHTLEELKTPSAAIFKQFLGNNSRELTTSSSRILSAFDQEGNIFSTCSITGEFLLDFIQVIICVMHCVPLLTAIPSDVGHKTHRWRSIGPLL